MATNNILDKYTNDNELINTLEAERVAVQNEDFKLILNDPALNALSHITTGILADINRKTELGKITVKNGSSEISVTMKTNKDGVPFDPVTQKLLILTKLKYTENGKKEITIPLDEYVKTLGLSNINKAREHAKKDAKLLSSMQVTMKYGHTKDQNEYRVNLFESSHYMGGLITFKLTDTFAEILSNGKNMPFPVRLLQIPCNSQKNPYVLAVGQKIFETCKLNEYDKKSEEQKPCFRLSVKSLLEVCYINGMKKPETIREEAKKVGKKPRLSQLITEPLEKTLRVLEDEGLIIYHYCYAKGETIPQTILDKKNTDFNEWHDRYIEFTYLPTYPRTEYDPKKITNKHAKNKKPKKQG